MARVHGVEAAVPSRKSQRSAREDTRHYTLAVLVAVALLAFARISSAQLVVNYGFTTNTNIPDDGTSQYTTSHVLGGFASYTDINVSLSLTSPDGDNPMWLGDMYSSLTLGLPSESSRAAVLLNRPGRDTSDPFGSSLDAFDVTLDDAAGSNVFGATGNGTFQSDGRSGVNPYGAPVNGGTRDATLNDLNGSSLTSNKFTLLVADTSAGGQAQLASWGMTVSGAAATSGTMSADGGTFSIADSGGTGDTNDLGANVVTTQNGSGGTLSVTLAGTTTFSGGVSGTGGLNKLGDGTLIINSAGSYTGPTTISAGILQLGDGGTTGTLSTSSAITNNGNLTVNRSNDIVQGTDFSGSAITGSGSLTQSGSGTLTLNAANTYSGTTTIDGGTIEAASNGALGSGTGTGTSSIIVTNGGTLLLSNSAATDRVRNNAAISLNGTIAIAPTSGNPVSEGTASSTPMFNVPPALGPNTPTPKPIETTSTIGLGALTLTGNSTLDFGADGVGTLVFADFMPSSFTLSIINYVSSASLPFTPGVDGTDDRLVFATDQSGNLGSFDFGGGFTAAQIALDDGFWEVIGVTAVPEPSTWLAGALALGAVVFLRRRPLARVLNKTQRHGPQRP